MDSYSPFVSGTTSCTIVRTSSLIQQLNIGCTCMYLSTKPYTIMLKLSIPSTLTNSQKSTLNGQLVNFINPYSLKRMAGILSVSSQCNGVSDANSENRFQFPSFSTEGTLTGLSFKSSTSIVGSQGNFLIVEFNPGSKFPLEGQMTLTLPYRYGTTSDFLDTMSSSIERVSLQFQTINIQRFVPGQLQVIEINYVLNQPTGCISCYFYDSSEKFSFKIGLLNNPITGVPVSGFSLSTQDFDQNKIDSVTTTYSLTVNDFGNMNSASVEITDTTNKYGTNHIGIPTSLITFNFKGSFILEPVCYFRIIFPSDIKINLNSKLDSFSSNGIASSPSTTFYEVLQYQDASTGNEFTILGCGDNPTLTSTFQGMIEVHSVVSPGQLRDTGNFIIEMYKDSQKLYRIASSQNLPSLKILKDSMTNSLKLKYIMITPISDFQISATTDVNISLAIGTNLFSDSIINIQLPPLVKGTSGGCSVTSWIPSLSNIPQCNFGTTLDTLIISNLFAAPPIPKTWATSIKTDPHTYLELWFQVQGVINQPSTRPGGQWSVKTQNLMPDSTFADVDTLKNDSYDCKPGTITSAAALNVNDDTTMKTSTTYQFKINLGHDITYNAATGGSGKLQIIFPSEIRLGSSLSVSSPSGKISSITKISATTVDVLINNLESIIAATDNPLILNIGGLQNPRSQKPTSEIKVISYDSQTGPTFYMIDQGSGFSTFMSKIGILDEVTVKYPQTTNTTNGGQSILSVTFKLASDDIRGGDTFYFTLPSELSINSVGKNFTCQPSNKVICKQSGNQIAASLQGTPSSTSYTNSFEFQVYGVINPSNMRPTSSVTNMYLKDSEGYFVAQSSTSTKGSRSITTTAVAQIQQFTKQPYQDNLSLGGTATYRIEFVTQGPIGPQGLIDLYWPPQVTIAQNAQVFVTSNGKVAVTTSIDVQSRKITIKDAFASLTSAYFGSVQIEISPVINPRDNRGLGSFSIFTYDDQDRKYGIDKLPEGFIFPITDCNYPCKSCLGGNRDYCVSCWLDSQLNYLQNSGDTQTCLSQCATGFTTNGNSQKVCIKCDQTCKSCLDSDRTKCVTCADSSKYFYPDVKKCSSQCEAGYFESSKLQCSPCKSPCQKCAGSATTCTDCFKDSKLPFLYSSTCVNSCPSGYAGIEQACLSCQSPCKTCLNSTSQCLSCDQKSQMKFFFAFQCLTSCPINTVADTTTNICKGCLTGCRRCDSKNQTKCLECESQFVLFNAQCLSDCPTGYKRSANKLGCDVADMQDLNLIYFPHLIAGLLLSVLAIGGYFKDRKSIILSNMLVFLGPIELLSYIVQFGLSLMFSTVVVTGATGLAIVTYIIINCVFAARFEKLVAKVDNDYNLWLSHHQKTYKFIMVMTKFFSFKMIRLNYSYLYGFDIFKVRFENPAPFRSVLRNYSILHGIFSSLVIIGIDVIILLQQFGIMNLPLPNQGIISIQTNNQSRILSTLQEVSKKFKIDSQMKIVMIETLVLSLIVVFLTIIEFIKLRQYMQYDYNQLPDDTLAFASLAEEKNDKQLRREMLKKIMQQVKGSQDLFNEGLNVHKADDLIHAFGKRRCRSMDQFENDREGDPRKVKSEPPSPKKDWGGDDSNRFKLEDNVYADSQPANPLGKIGKEYTDAETWVIPEEFLRIMARKGGDFLQFDDHMDKSYRRTRDKNKKRGRKNQYYTQIDAEDDQEVENLNDSDYLGSNKKSKMVVIKEEEEKKKGSSSKKKSSPSPDTKKKQLEAEAAARLREEREAKKLEDEISNGLQRSPTFGKDCEDPKVQVPPDHNKRTFNENDILGDFDRDEKGNLIILQDQYGNYVDKQGRRVNERGYLIDPSSGDIIENQDKKTMFPKNDLDDRGEIPAPFCVEKYNFNPFKIRGEFNLDKNKNPIITKNRNGDKVDKYNRIVNSKGWLVDRKGNVVDLMGVKKFDARQLNPDNGDLPRLFNYQGKRFDIMDVCGAFDLNPHNGEIVLQKNAQGQFFDKFGRLVNQKGYLIDVNGNVVDREGKRIFDRKHLSSNGEIPKIFPFTKFNINSIQGDFEMDPLGNPILEKRSDGFLYDRQGRRVNSKGYFIDLAGSVLDKKGKIMFNRDLLDSDGEIPEIFRNGMLKSDSASSLSRLMSEIERNQPEELYNNRNPRRATKMINANSGGDTSYESGMEETPSNYNKANQRINQRARQSRIAQIDEEDASIISGGVDDDGNFRKRKKAKKRRKKVVQEYSDPSDKDIMMAKAYGGVARGAPKRIIPKGINPRGIHSPKSQMSHNRALQQIAGSVSGLRKNQPSMRAVGDAEESKSKINQNQSMAVLNETNDPSVMAVPEHHLREEKLKRQKLKEAQMKGKLRRKNGALAGPGDPDFEKMFGKDIDEFLEDSDWDVESFDNMSQFSRGTAKSAFLDNKIRGLESIYLQRIESGMKRGVKKGSKGQKAKFRVLQDRFIDDPSYINEGVIDGPLNEGSSQMSQRKQAVNNQSAMGQYAARNMSVTAQTQFLPRSQTQNRQQL